MKQKVNINKIKGNPSNPRIIKDEKFKKLVKSIDGFPEMLEKRPIVVDEDMMVLGGNMRWKACKDAGLKEVWIDVAEGWTQEQKDEFIIKDNANFGEWDWDILANEWDSVELNEWGLDVWQLYTNTDVNMVNSGDENDEWVGMPEFESKEAPLKIVISFQTEKDREEFAELHKLQFIKKQQNAWMSRYPYDGRDDLNSLKYK